MCTRNECITRLTEATPFIREQFGVKSLSLFGSMARGDNTSSSDVDVCVDMPPKAFKLIALKIYLQELLGVDVDVVRMSSYIDNFLINEINRDGICIFS
jgi:predicted nucleotidyltransferase